VALLGTSFQIGRSALAAYQAAISVAGQNIANIGNPDYTRQSGHLDSLPGGSIFGVRPGAGVRLSALERHIDQALEGRLRLALGSRSGAEVTYQALSQTEALFNELTEQDLSSELSELFSTFATLQTSPTDDSARSMIISAADSVIRTLQRHRSGLLQQTEDLNQSAAALALNANEIAAEIASLNETIVVQEADGHTIASALRDRRDTLLRDLAELMDLQVREQANGSVNVYVGSDPLIEFDRSRGFEVETVLENGLEVATVRFADDHGTVILREGQLAATLQVRDDCLAEQLDRLDQLAGALIYEVNRVHSTGVGLNAYSAITSNYTVNDPDAALNSAAAGLPFPLQNGSFIVHMRDTSSGQVTTQQIEIDLDGIGNDDTTLNDLASMLSGVSGLTATVTGDNHLQLTADSGAEFWFSEDSSRALAALGLGAFFTGTNAANIDVVSAVRQDPRLIAASLTGQVHDGDNAGRLASAGEASSALLNTLSLSDYHQASVGELATETAGALTAYDAADAVYTSLYAQREAISGVSLDEEAINLAKYERAYQGATRYLSVLDDLADEVLALIG
jgi:flagellar hook-associated protein 1 FlgK